MDSFEEKYSYAEFIASGLDGRRKLCADLSAYLTDQMDSALSKCSPRYEHQEEVVFGLMKKLRTLGHDLWSWDVDEKHELWGYDYSKKGQIGLVLWVFYFEEVEVYWREEGCETLY